MLLFGGIETTEGMIANAVWHLLATRTRWRAVRADPASLAGVVEESLRLEPAAARVDRYATADVELGGARIAAGTSSMVSSPPPTATRPPSRTRTASTRAARTRGAT